jgi:multiple sugar transport system substrate-binding protein
MAMKKNVTLLLSMVLSFSLFGCSSGNKDGQSGSTMPANTQTAVDSAKPKEPVKIKFYTYKANKPEEPTVQAVKKFNETHPDIQVEYVDLVQNNDSVEFFKKLDILVGAGEAVDVFQTGNLEQLMERAARGVVEPLDDLYKAHNLKPADEYVLNPDMNGKTYGMVASAQQWLVAFNKDHLKAANLELPKMGWTWDDFRDYAKKMTTKDHYGAYFHTWGDYVNTISYLEMPNPTLKADRSLNFDDPSYKYFFELRRAMEKEDKSVEPYADVMAGKYHVLKQFFAGKASMIAVPTYIIDAGTQLDKFPHDFQMVFAPVPRSSAKAELGLTNITGSFFAMGSKSKNKDAAFTFMRWMTTEGAEALKNPFTGWKKADGKQLLTTFYGQQTKLIDIETLASTLFDPRNKMPSNSFSVPYGSELKTVTENAFTKYMLDNTTFEEAQKYMMDEGKKIIEKNKK